MPDGNGTAGFAADELTSAVYTELRRIAARYLQSERPNHSLQPTALVHEVYLRLRDQRQHFQNRSHLCGVAAGLMRLVLVDYARRRNAAQRAVENSLLLENAEEVSGRDNVDFFVLDDALKRLAAVDPKLVRVVELRFFGGLTLEETAEEMGISSMAVKREWQFAKAWLYRQLS
jgi:RNA polymerase sigma factor (TIGR02999 family)